MKKEMKAITTEPEKKKSINPRIISSRETDGNQIVAAVYDDANYIHDDGDCS